MINGITSDEFESAYKFMDGIKHIFIDCDENGHKLSTTCICCPMINVENEVETILHFKID